MRRALSAHRRINGLCSARRSFRGATSARSSAAARDLSGGRLLAGGGLARFFLSLGSFAIALQDLRAFASAFRLALRFFVVLASALQPVLGQAQLLFRHFRTKQCALRGFFRFGEGLEDTGHIRNRLRFLPFHVLVRTDRGGAGVSHKRHHDVTATVILLSTDSVDKSVNDDAQVSLNSIASGSYDATVNF